MHWLKRNIEDLVDCFKAFLPQNRVEIYLFGGFFIFYLSYSLLLIFNTSIIDNKDILLDVYFSFDNPIVFRDGTLNPTAHPLLYYITFPVLFIGNLLSLVLCYKIKTLFVVLVCNALISMSSIYIYRYLSDIIRLKKYILFLLTFFYSFTSTNLILCFTPESYTITAFLLTFLVYYFSLKIKNNQTVGLFPCIMLFVSLGGATITNFAKVIGPVLFLKDKIGTKLLKIAISGLIFSIPVLYMVYKGYFLGEVSFSLYMNNVNNLEYLPVPALTLLLNFFLAAPVLFPEVIISNLSITDTPFYAITLDYFSYWWQFLIIIPIFLLMLISVIINYRNRFIFLLLSIVLVDIIVHFIIQYGLTSLFIYGAHWIFIIPLLLGWLYKTLKTKLQKNIFSASISVIFICLFVNNLWRLYAFIRLAFDNFPPQY